MQAPISWIKDFIKIEVNATALDNIAERLTFAGIEVSHIEAVGIYHENVVVAEIVKLEKIKEKLFHLVVNVGDRTVQTVSTAAELADFQVGEKIAFGLLGAVLFGENYQLKTLQAGVLYNVPSEGAVCSQFELGIGEDNNKLVKIAASEANGTPVKKVLPAQENWFADYVLHLEILANIARCQSIIGVARELAALTNVKGKYELTTFDLQQAKSTSIHPIISKPTHIHNFATASVEAVTVKPANDLIRRRLALCGVASINNLVDIGNYVMMETGQPLHVYDAAQLQNPVLEATVLTEKTAFLPLSKEEEVKEMQIPENTIVIKSGDEIVSVAGLIGGKKSSVSDNTTSILIEAANFDLISLRKAQAHLNLYTEASKRFSRGVDLALSRYGLARYLQLLSDSLGSDITLSNYGYTEVLAAEAFEIPFTAEELNAAVGIQISAQEIIETLAHLNIACVQKDEEIIATITSYRQDITIKQDIFEEIARLVGYDRMQTTMPTGGLPAHPANTKLKLRETARDALVAAGLQEIMNYSLTQEILEKNLYIADKEANTEFSFIKMLNPVSVDKAVMRRSLMTGLLTTIAYNLRHQEGIRLFEIGQVFLPQAHQKLPNEPYHIAIGMTGTVSATSIYETKPRQVDFFDLKAAVEFLFQHLHIAVEISPIENIAPYQNGMCAKVTKGEKVYGYMGKIHPLVAKAYDMEGQVIYAASFDFEEIMTDVVRDFAFDEYSKFPSMGEDIALIINEKHTAGDLKNAIFALNDSLLQSVEIFDEYKDEQTIGKDLRSLGIRLMLNAKTRTLSQEEANTSRDAVSTMLAEKFGALIRK